MTPKNLILQLFKALSIVPETLALSESDGRTNINVTVSEADSGILIGHHGETIDALQTIISLILNHGQAVYQPIIIDINLYRQKRLVNLEELAKKAASQSIESGREIILPPLSSFERRHIHLFLEKDNRVNTYSEGDGVNRRLIVHPNH